MYIASILINPARHCVPRNTARYSVGDHADGWVCLKRPAVFPVGTHGDEEVNEGAHNQKGYQASKVLSDLTHNKARSNRLSHFMITEIDVQHW